MLDIKLIREKPEIVRENLKKRNMPLELLEDFLKADADWRALKQEAEQIRQKRNQVSEEINQLVKQGKTKEVEKKVQEAKTFPQQLASIEQKLIEKEKERRVLWLKLPNILADDVPTGKDDKGNVEIKKIGNPQKFSFPAKNHLDIALSLDLIDGERAAKVSGNGFFYLKEELALLNHALQCFAVDFMRKKGYKLIEPPYMLKRDAYEGVVSLADFENVMYKIENEDLYMIATAEHPIAALFMDEVLDENQLPLKFVGISTNFRKEIGTHGKYTKGLFRMHQFHKVEQFIFCKPEDSWKLHEELQKNSEEIYKLLGLPIRVVNLCTGDTGLVAAKTYDTEVWMSDNVYREIGSNSNCTDYQARRLNIKYRKKPGSLAEGFVHTLNNTAIATSRVMLAILENYQQKDGSVEIPKVLWKYMGIKKIKVKKK